MIWAIIAVIILIIVIYKTETVKEKKAIDMPKHTITLQHGSGDSFPEWDYKVHYKKSNGELNFWDLKSKEKISLSVDKINSFYMLGEISHNTAVKGGGTSLGGAVVGATVAGPVGAVIGGRKKVKSSVQTTNTQTLIIKFNDDGQEKGIKIFQPICIYEDLCYLCPEKKATI